MITRRGPRDKLRAPTVFEKIELWLKIATFAVTLLAVLTGGGWALYQYLQKGGSDWNIGLRLETKILPYHGNLRLLVVNVKSKNPLKYETDIDPAQGDSFDLYIRKLALSARKGTVMDEDSGELVRKISLIDEGDTYELLPGVEFDDMRMIVLPVHTVVAVRAEVNIHNGNKDRNGKPDTDYVADSTVVRAEP